MNLQSAFGGIAIGRNNSSNFRPSLRGVAVRIEKSRFVGLDNNQLLDVTPFTFDNADNVVYRVPVRNATVGDLIVSSDAPLRVLFVQDVLDNGHLKGLDPTSGAVIAPRSCQTEQAMLLAIPHWAPKPKDVEISRHWGGWASLFQCSIWR